MRLLACTLLLVLALAAAGCNGDATGETTGETEDYEEPTLAVTEEDAEEETAEAPVGLQYAEPEPPAAGDAVVLRLEGGRNTRFSGVCIVGEERTVISGQVPKRYEYDLNGQELECRIQKQSPGSDILKVILTDGERTRSVQQTDQRGSTIELTHTAQPPESAAG
jgi:hypothetical protein